MNFPATTSILLHACNNRRSNISGIYIDSDLVDEHAEGLVIFSANISGNTRWSGYLNTICGTR